MRRLFWVAVGATAGVYAVRKVKRTVRAYTPAGLADRADSWRDTALTFADEVRARMADREEELRAALGIDGADAVDLSPAEAADLTDHPTAPRTPRPAPETTTTTRKTG